jgi:hypothetical protein
MSLEIGKKLFYGESGIFYIYGELPAEVVGKNGEINDKTCV